MMGKIRSLPALAGCGGERFLCVVVVSLLQSGPFSQGVAVGVGAVLPLFGGILFVPLLMQITEQNILLFGNNHLFRGNVHGRDVDRGPLRGCLHAIFRVEQRKVVLVVAG